MLITTRIVPRRATMFPSRFHASKDFISQCRYQLKFYKADCCKTPVLIPNNELKFTCMDCFLYLFDYDETSKHVRMEHAIRCDLCKTLFKGEDKMDKHFIDCHMSGPNVPLITQYKASCLSCGTTHLLKTVQKFWSFNKKRKLETIDEEPGKKLRVVECDGLKMKIARC